MDFSLDIGQLRGLGTLLVMVAFTGLCLWVSDRRRDHDFAEARLLPFADDRLPPASQQPDPRKPQP
ncbi:CcoQ/FixQ family Cbb3-type cytochrome c oxidase assembly chaperone [Pseudomonas fulva]|nr:CcoQ/FixQ family Cbb3-type cytochrome c oxidase assembly chaperone [Pseudomonas fulva]MBF8779173.1 CcoQ/FixQ family Cbb3-type cytochrome c oxidase assembly chaperone [Pseudomonas fulva]